MFVKNPPTIIEAPRVNPFAHTIACPTFHAWIEHLFTSSHLASMLPSGILWWVPILSSIQVSIWSICFLYSWLPTFFYYFRASPISITQSIKKPHVHVNFKSPDQVGKIKQNRKNKKLKVACNDFGLHHMNLPETLSDSMHIGPCSVSQVTMNPWIPPCIEASEKQSTLSNTQHKTKATPKSFFERIITNHYKSTKYAKI